MTQPIPPQFPSANPQQPPQMQPVQQPRNTSATSPFAIASLSCAILGIFTGLFCTPLIFLLSIVAIILGHIARAEIRKNPSIQGAGLALAGLITGYIGLALSILLVVFMIGMMAIGMMEHNQ